MENRLLDLFYIIAFFIFLLVVFVLALYSIFIPPSFSVDTEALNALSLDFEPLLTSEWEIQPINSVGNEDFIDRSRSIGDHIVVSAQHLNNPRGFIAQHIIAYNNAETAENRFNRQVERVIVYNYGVPISRQIYSYADVELPPGSNIVADDYRIACIETPFKLQCGAFFLQDSYVIYLDVFRVRDNIEYLTEAEFFSLIDAINARIATSEE
ncbi:MAG: hypothetical protein RLP44_07300 [Aggregatilineales bacterium]